MLKMKNTINLIKIHFSIFFDFLIAKLMSFSCFMNNIFFSDKDKEKENIKLIQNLGLKYTVYFF